MAAGEDHGKRHCDDESGRDDAEVGQESRLGHSWRPGDRLIRLLEGAGDEVVDDARGDHVEHDGGDDLVHAAVSLEQGRDRRPHRAAEHADGERSEDEHGPRQSLEVVAGPRGANGGHQQLALGTDVEEAHLERDSDRESLKDQRGRLLQRAELAVRAEQRGLEQRVVCLDRVHALHGDESRADEQREQNREHRHHQRLVLDGDVPEPRQLIAALGDDDVVSHSTPQKR